jgi:hypothetical protein
LGDSERAIVTDGPGSADEIGTISWPDAAKGYAVLSLVPIGTTVPYIKCDWD